jgi:predicted ArsR family transcriptional regulator
MADPNVSPAKRRVLELLKRLGATPVPELARRLDLTEVAVRQHLAALEDQGLAAAEPGPAKGRGRPSALWSLTDAAASLFPDSHADLTVSLIQATRRALGEKGLERVVAERSADQLRTYRDTLPGPDASLGKRVKALAAQRTAEGYMAEVRREAPGRYLLVEHHCPICEAARSCQRLCAGELHVFREYLGPDVDIERVDHLLDDADRCAYRIEAA